MIGQIISSVGSLATSYIDGKTAVQKANAEIKMKQATGEINWEQAAIEASNNSYKDEPEVNDKLSLVVISVKAMCSLDNNQLILSVYIFGFKNLW